MQIGQVPYQYVPERIVNSTDAITLEPERADIMVPSLAPFIPEPVAVEPDCFFCDATRAWLAAGAAFLILWTMRKPRR